MSSNSILRLLAGANLRAAAILASAMAFAQGAWAGTTYYNYDSLGRVTKVVYSNGSATTYSYDAAGNRISKTSSAVGSSAPVANNDSVSANNGVAMIFDPRSNDSDSYGYALTITGVGAPAHGTASFTGTSVSYTPSRGYTGSDSFSYTISDGHGNTASATITAAVTGLLTNGLSPGETQYSPDGRFWATLQTDGNFVLYYVGSGALWAAGTTGSGALNAIFQSDGNLVVYNASAGQWASNTSGHSGASIAVQNDGNMVIYYGSGSIWATNTCCH